MAQTPPLDLSNIVDITVTVSPSAVTANQFNQGLFVGPSAVIPSYGTNPRLRQYTSTTAMLSDGFTISDPEYIAAQIYFSQSPAAQFVWIGRQDLTAVGAIVIDGRTVLDGAMSSVTNPTFLTSATAAFVSGDVGLPVRVIGAGTAGADLVTTVASVTSGTVAVLASPCLTTVTAKQVSVGFVGSGYVAGDTFTVTQSGGSNDLITVATVGASGVPLSLSIGVGQGGTGFTTASALPTVATSPSAGTGLEVNITAGESLLQAAQACRAASNVWYGLAVNNPSDADNLALSAWADPLWRNTRYYPWSSTVGIVNATTNNIALQLKALKLRVLGTYATTQSGLYPDNIYAAAAVMGVEMGLNTGLGGSFFTTAHKQLAGIAPEPLTQTQYTNIINAGFNAYCNFDPYELYEPGVMSNGTPSFLWLNLAVLVQNLTLNELGVLEANPVVPQTNSGEHLLIQAAEAACQNSQNIGFLADGVWKGQTISIPGVTLTYGQAIPGGFLVQAQPYSVQSSNDRAAGKAMPLYVAVTSAGAVQSLLIGVYAQL
jgi:hypothetical protein